MKTFRIHLKDGKSFTVTAHHFERNNANHFTFYKSQTEVDNDIWVFTSEVVAIVPQERDNVPALPGTVGYQSY